MLLKIFLGSIIAFALLVCIGANEKHNKRLAAVIAIVALTLFAIAVLDDTGKKGKEITAVAPESGKIEVDKNSWGTITVTDRETGVTREYQGCINISGNYPYETYELMGLCVRMDAAITIGEWDKGMYKLYYENEEAYWKEKEKQEKGVEGNE